MLVELALGLVPACFVIRPGRYVLELAGAIGAAGGLSRRHAHDGGGAGKHACHAGGDAGFLQRAHGLVAQVIVSCGLARGPDARTGMPGHVAAGYGEHGLRRIRARAVAGFCDVPDVLLANAAAGIRGQHGVAAPCGQGCRTVVVDGAAREKAHGVGGGEGFVITAAVPGRRGVGGKSEFALFDGLGMDHPVRAQWPEAAGARLR